MIERRRYIIILLVIVFLSSCGFNLFNIVDERNQELNSRPTKAIIDNNNNGVISFGNKILKIKNLEITNQEIDLGSTNKNNRVISSMSYISNKEGDGFLIYSIDHIVEYLKREEYKEVLGIKHYLIPIKRNEFLTKENKLVIDKDLIGKSIVAYSDNDVVYLAYLNNVREYTPGHYIFGDDGNLKGSFNIKKINLKNFNISEITIDKSRSRIEIDNELSLDKNGDGFYSWSRPDLSKVKDYKEISDNFKNTKDNNIFSSYFLDYEGNGLVISDYSNYKEREIFFSKYKNYERLSIDKIHIDSTFKPAENFVIEGYGESNRYPLLFGSFVPGIESYFNNILVSKYFNKNGDGILFIEPYDNSKGLYFQKLSSFKLSDKIEQILDKKSKFKYYDYALNENGNGLLFLTDGKTFKTKKILNFQVQK